MSQNRVQGVNCYQATIYTARGKQDMLIASEARSGPAWPAMTLGRLALLPLGYPAGLVGAGPFKPQGVRAAPAG